VYFIEHPAFFDRAGIYGSNGTGDYPDNAHRFAFFCLAALTVLPQIAPEARVLHAHDWHTALAPVYLRLAFSDRPEYERLATVLAVHNAGFQGHFPAGTVPSLGLPPELFTPAYFEWYGRLNVLKSGLTFADVAVTVSPTHARELRTPEGGFGLHDLFGRLSDRFVGILNGIDLRAWDPRTDSHLPATYSADDLGGKRRCKAALQESYGLPSRTDAPLVVMSARLVSQKGLDLVLGADLLGSTDAQFIFLGSGETRYHAALTELAAAAPDRLAVEFAFTDHLEHRLLAGADLLLMPSLYEPCGLTQMRAQRYGTIPIARRVGGLVDSVDDGDTGFLFDAYDPAALEGALRRGLERYRDGAGWEAMMRRALSRPCGWQPSADAYLALYHRALAGRPVSA
jgi:starch synthase